MTSRVFYVIELEGQEICRGQKSLHVSQDFDHALSFDHSLSRLEVCLAWFDGRFEGWYQQDGKTFIGTARVSFLEDKVPEDHVINSWACVCRLPVPGIHRDFCAEEGYQVLSHNFDASYGGTCP
jgi:hypothetical protein